MTLRSALNRDMIMKMVPVFLTYVASGGSLVISSAAQLVTFGILARFLGVEQFSLFVSMMAITNIVVHLCGLGAMEPLVRRTAQDASIYPKMLGHNIILAIPSGLILVLIGILVLPSFFTLSSDPAYNRLLIGIMLFTNIIFVRFIVLFEQIFIAHQKFQRANLVVLSFAFARLLAAGTGCLLFGVHLLSQFVYWQFAAHLLAFGGSVLALRPLGAPRWGLVKEELPQGIYFSVPFILRALRQNIDLIILNIVSSAEIVAAYGVARRIVDSSYLSVEALNRLIYPGSAIKAAKGLHHARERVHQVALAALVISFFTALCVCICAPILPLLFGKDYHLLIGYTRILCWAVIPMALWVVAVEGLGASGHQRARAGVISSGSILGSILIAAATWFAAPHGTFAAIYCVEIALVFGAWWTFRHIANASLLSERIEQDAGMSAPEHTNIVSSGRD